jgi:hypothetical protein
MDIASDVKSDLLVFDVVIEVDDMSGNFVFLSTL